MVWSTVRWNIKHWSSRSLDLHVSTAIQRLRRQRLAAITPTTPAAVMSSSSSVILEENTSHDVVDRPTSFLDLPLELRQMIYNYALPDEQHVSTIPALLKCNLQICREASGLCTHLLTIKLCLGECVIFEPTSPSPVSEAADKIKRIHDEGKRPKIRLETVCFNAGWGRNPLKPLLELIRTTKLPKVEVTLSDDECKFCKSHRSWRPDRTNDRNMVAGLIERTEYLRDHDTTRCGIYRTKR